MVGIPKQFLTVGVEATEAARAAVAKLEKMKVFVPESKLVRQPAEDLFEKAAEMNSKAFWEDVENMGHYIRGQHLADIAEGKYVAVPDGKVGKLGFYGDVKASFNAEGKPERVLIDGKHIYEINPETEKISALIRLDKNGKIGSITKYDDEGYQIQEVIPAKGNKPKVVVDLSYDGGYPYRKTEYFADGTFAVTENKTKKVYVGKECVKEYFYKNCDTLGMPYNDPKLYQKKTYKNGVESKVIDIDPETKEILSIVKA